MPIADADGGDLICLGLKEDYRDKVYYWYHEEELVKEDGAEHLNLIANTFKEFIFKFKKHVRKIDFELDDIDVFLDEDLLKD